ncbi:MAG: hypothetical protein AB1781_09130 [Pseudomonadota bacterium]
MANSKTGFGDPKQLISFAEQFLSGQTGRLRKDIAACITPGVPGGKPAYFPALMTLVGFIEMLGCLYEGNLCGRKKIFLQYAKKYMWLEKEVTEYEEALDILYETLRHKVAHLSHPYYVTRFPDPDKQKKGNSKKLNKDPKRITWEVGFYEDRLQTLTLIPTGKEKLSIPAPGLPWDVYYDHLLRVDITSFANHAVASVSRYFDDLKRERILQEKFEKCMQTYYPKE